MPRRTHPRTAADVNHWEEQQIEDLIVGDDDDAPGEEAVDVGGSAHHPDRGATDAQPGSAGVGGGGEGEAEEEGDQGRSGSAGAADHDAQQDVGGGVQHQTTPQEQPPATPPTFPADRQQQLALAAANIKANMATHTGVQKTYSQYWKTYDNWHKDGASRNLLRFVHGQG